MKKTAAASLVLAILATVAPEFSTAFAQGSLTPPGGPAPTMKTLDQVEPRIGLPSGGGLGSMIITEPGSYYFTGDRELTGTAFFIRTNGVTIDLNGYTLRNPASTAVGILVDGSASAPYHGITIKNGTIEGFSYGVRLTAASGCRVENVTVTGAGNIGFFLDAGDTNAENNVFRECAALKCGGAGFDLEGPGGNCRGNLLLNCSASSGGGSGFEMFGSSSVGNVSGNILRDGTANGNATDGFRLVASVGECQGNRVINSVATLNGSDGFDLSSSSLGRLGGNVIEDCQSVSNAANGILLNGYGGAIGNKITRNVCMANGQRGIWTGGSDAGFTTCNFCVTNPTANFLLDSSDINGPIVSSTGTLATSGAAASPWANFER